MGNVLITFRSNGAVSYQGEKGRLPVTLPLIESSESPGPHVLVAALQYRPRSALL